MSPRKKDPGTGLAPVEEHSANIVPETAASEAFSTYAEQRDEMLATPFARNRSLARCGAPFTVLRVTEGSFPSMQDPDVYVPAYVYLCRSQVEWVATDEQSGEVFTFAEGEQFVLKLNKGSVRDRDAEKLRELLQRFDEVPNLALQEYPTRKRGFSNAHGIVHVSSWKPVRELMHT